VVFLQGLHLFWNLGDNNGANSQEVCTHRIICWGKPPMLTFGGLNIHVLNVDGRTGAMKRITAAFNHRPNLGAVPGDGATESEVLSQSVHLDGRLISGDPNCALNTISTGNECEPRSCSGFARWEAGWFSSCDRFPASDRFRRVWHLPKSFH